jgi:apocytochrome f
VETETWTTLPRWVKSNNNIYNSSVSGTITGIEAKKTTISILMANGKPLLKKVPQDQHCLEGQTVQADQPLTNNPNVGFGQAETEIVLQNPARVQGLIVFF